MNRKERDTFYKLSVYRINVTNHDSFESIISNDKKKWVFIHIYRRNQSFVKHFEILPKIVPFKESFNGVADYSNIFMSWV